MKNPFPRYLFSQQDIVSTHNKISVQYDSFITYNWYQYRRNVTSSWAGASPPTLVIPSAIKDNDTQHWIAVLFYLFCRYIRGWKIRLILFSGCWVYIWMSVCLMLFLRIGPCNLEEHIILWTIKLWI